MSYSKKISHEEEALANLIEQFKDKPKIAGILKSYLRQIQGLENVLSDMLTKTTLDDAEGVHLDNIGSIVGEPRSGRNDLQYRTAIRARIGLNVSEGTMEDVIAIALSVAGETVTITTTELFPAGFLMVINEPIDPALTDVNRIASFIASGRPAGVRGLLIFGVLGSFQYDGPLGTGFDDGKYGGAVSA